jgi:hypothetical protein
MTVYNPTLCRLNCLRIFKSQNSSSSVPLRFYAFFGTLKYRNQWGQWRPYMGAKGAFAPPVFIFLFQPKVFHCLLENLTKKTHYLLWVFKDLPPLNFELSPLLNGGYPHAHFPGFRGNAHVDNPQWLRYKVLFIKQRVKF